MSHPNTTSDELETHLTSYIHEQAMNGIVCSTADIESYLDSRLERLEKDAKKELLSEEEFETLCNKLKTKYVEAGAIYLESDWKSYMENVGAKKLVALGESDVMEFLKQQSSVPHVFKNTEFALDSYGRFLRPLAGVHPPKHGYSTTFVNGKICPNKPFQEKAKKDLKSVYFVPCSNDRNQD